MKRPPSVPTSLVLMVLALLLIQINGSIFTARVDLTEEQIHSLSEASLDVIAALDAPVTLTYFVSERLQREFSEPQRIEDIVRSYAIASPRSVDARVESVDVQRVESEELPLAPQPLSVADASEQSVATVFSGVTVEYLDRVVVIPFVFDWRDLEYRLTTSIRSLVDDSLPAVAVISSAPGGLFGEARLLESELASLFALSEVRGAEISPETAVAIVDGAESLDPQVLLSVESFLERGGSVLLLAEAARVGTDGSLRSVPTDLAPLNGFLRRWGMELGSELLLDGNANPIPIQELSETGPVNRFVDYSLWPVMTERNTSPEHPVTTRFSGLDLYWSGVVRLLAGHPAAAQALVASSPDAWLMRRPYRVVPGNPDTRRDRAETMGQYATVVQSSRESSGTLVVVSDTDFVRDLLVESTASYENIDFAVQAVQYLANEPALLALRSRSERSRTPPGVGDPDAREALERFARVVSIGAVPAFVLTVGSVILVRRRRRSSGRRT